MELQVEQNALDFARKHSTQKAQVLAVRTMLRSLPAIGLAPAEFFEEHGLPVLMAAILATVAASGSHQKISERTFYRLDSGWVHTGWPVGQITEDERVSSSAFKAVLASLKYGLQPNAMDLPGVLRAPHNHPPFGQTEAEQSAYWSQIGRYWKAIDLDGRQLEESLAKTVIEHPLWQGEAMPEIASNALSTFFAQLDAAGSNWNFWKRWYDGLLTGQPLPWELQRDVALIPVDEWKKGPERIAELIREIEASYPTSPGAFGNADWSIVEKERVHSGQALKEHVRHLLEQGAAAEINAIGLAWQIRSAIADYCNQNRLNEVPEELRPFEAIAEVLARMGGNLAQSRMNDEINDQIVDKLEAQVAELQVRIKSLELELAESRAKEVKGLIKQSILKGIGTQVSVALMTSTLSAAAFMIAPEFSHELTRHLGKLLMEQFERPPQYFPQIGKD